MASDEDLRPRPGPRRDDVLFPAALDEWNTTARVPKGKREAEALYAEGYRIAAHILTEETSKANWEKNALVFPIVYLYRHHIELVLKGLIRHGSYLVDRTFEASQLGTHDLSSLWQRFKPILEEISTKAGWEAPHDDHISGIDSYIRQLTEVDPGSHSFRYATDKSGDPSLPDHLEHVNITTFAEAMERLADYLNAIACGFLGLFDLKSDMEHEVRFDFT